MICPSYSFYSRLTEIVARQLIGKKLVRTISRDGKKLRIAGIIVETEAYGHEDDPASHACRGITSRNSVMFGNVGHAYVYFTYGNHFCVNVSARSGRTAAGAVLIRALQPVEGIEVMKEFRRTEDIFSLASGPGKLTQALSIAGALNGTDMTERHSDLRIEYGTRPRMIVASPRIGITRALDRHWRFVLSNSPFVSKTLAKSSVFRRAGLPSL